MSFPFLRPVRLAVICCLAASGSGLAQSTPGRTLLALSKADHTLAIVDPSNLEVLARIPVGSDPHEVIASADGRTAFVSIYGGGSLHEIDILDLEARKSKQQFDTRPLLGPHGLDFADGKLWFTAEGSKAVARFDPATGQVDWLMGTGQDRTHMIYVAAGGKRIYTTNVASGTVSILVDTPLQPRMGPPPGAPQGPLPGSPAGTSPGAPAGKSSAGTLPQGNPPPGPRAHEDWQQTVIPVSRGSEGFDVSPDGRELWTAAADDGTIAIIDLMSKKKLAIIDAGCKGANRLKFTPDGQRVFVASLSTGELSIFDAEKRQLVKRVKVGHGAAGILMDKEGSRAFVACSADNYIAIVDLGTLKVTGRLSVGGVPDGMAWAIKP
ncbi:MAG TPA: cytochrome D1 domain-containing protein [Puia sp.]|nr:cytochrome D1 domain-containing protein [Puia sp.]